MNHTPGPWRARQGIYTAEIRAEGACDVSIASFGANCTAGVDGSYSVSADEALANAQLSAAAPEMLEALKEIARWNEQDDGDLETCRMQWRGSVAIARGILSKLSRCDRKEEG